MTNSKKRSQRRKVRLVVRRTRLVSQAELWDDWRYHAFVTNLDLAAVEADRHHHPTGEDDTHTEESTDTEPAPNRQTTDATVEAGRRTGTTAATPPANSPSATSKAQGVSPIYPPVSSPLTPRGCSAPPWPTTSTVT